MRRNRFETGSRQRRDTLSLPNSFILRPVADDGAWDGAGGDTNYLNIADLNMDTYGVDNRTDSTCTTAVGDSSTATWNLSDIYNSPQTARKMIMHIRYAGNISETADAEIKINNISIGTITMQTSDYLWYQLEINGFWNYRDLSNVSVSCTPNAFNSKITQIKTLYIEVFA